jgi:hypothetical protein
MPTAEINLLVLGDPHHGGGAVSAGDGRPRLGGARIARKALQRLSREGIRPDAISLLGDLAADGQEQAAGRLTDKRTRVFQLGKSSRNHGSLG